MPEEGLTIILYVLGQFQKATLYISSSISTPSEAFYDAVIETDGWDEIYLEPNDLCNDKADIVYITILGDYSANVTYIIVMATNGNALTGNNKLTLITCMVPEKYISVFTVE